MAKKPQYNILYAPDVKAHVRAIEAKYHSIIRETIKEQLEFEPDVETRNRKPLQRAVAFEAEWELRFGHRNRFRVFYSIDDDAREVRILAIAVKLKNRLWIGGEEVEL